jgi:hypothetical protein
VILPTMATKTVAFITRQEVTLLNTLYPISFLLAMQCRKEVLIMNLESQNAPVMVYYVQEQKRKGVRL